VCICVCVHRDSLQFFGFPNHHMMIWLLTKISFWNTSQSQQSPLNSSVPPKLPSCHEIHAAFANSGIHKNDSVSGLFRTKMKMCVCSCVCHGMRVCAHVRVYVCVCACVWKKCFLCLSCILLCSQEEIKSSLPFMYSPPILRAFIYSPSCSLALPPLAFNTVPQPSE